MSSHQGPGSRRPGRKKKLSHGSEERGNVSRFGADSGWLTKQAGTYLLLFRLEAALALTVGRLGRRTLAAGWYVYVGSALGGLGHRVARHLRQDKPRHWHVDALRELAEPIEIAWCISRERLECTIATRLAESSGATRPIARFGASDCRCPAHLVHFPERPDLHLDETWTVSPVRPLGSDAACPLAL